MQYSGFKIGRIPITAELLLYALLTISVISGVVVNVLRASINTNSFLELFIYGLISLLMGIGFIAIIWEVTKRWHRVGGVLFIAIAIFILWGIIYSYNQGIGTFYDTPYLLAPPLVLITSLAISGTIIIMRGKSFLTTKGK